MTPKTCSKESGAKLQALGVTVPSYFVHREFQSLPDSGSEGAGVVVRRSDEHGGWYSQKPAWTVGELGEMLPNSEIIYHTFVACKGSEMIGRSHAVSMLRSPDFLCEMLIWLITEGHVTVEKINKGAKQ